MHMVCHIQFTAQQHSQKQTHKKCLGKIKIAGHTGCVDIECFSPTSMWRLRPLWPTNLVVDELGRANLEAYDEVTAAVEYASWSHKERHGVYLEVTFHKD
eukprot:gnl/MRDRNA2_/MRDRNA2_601363_c0_seq1.p1 gnl/MRDRNA2_/MRDRNA2_601363_c0~~gnl/MRDRNA2_/MRDRNA2_601363_c0_seq1.p1  ORF type:complete len:100 (-),score=8.09 gnl/MRDRNA2_/MRDRNA2_601363_c0_seq1:36-335(-)